MTLDKNFTVSDDIQDFAKEKCIYIFLCSALRREWVTKLFSTIIEGEDSLFGVRAKREEENIIQEIINEYLNCPFIILADEQENLKNNYKNFNQQLFKEKI